MSGYKTIFEELVSAYSRRFNKSVSTDVIANTLGFPVDVLTDADEVLFVRHVFDYLKSKATDFIVKGVEIPYINSCSDIDGSDNDGDIRACYEFGDPEFFQKYQNPTLISHLKKLPDMNIDNWRVWINSSPSTFESKRVRCGYVIRFASDPLLRDLNVEDGVACKAILDGLVGEYDSGKIKDVGVKTTEKKLSEQALIDQWFKEPLRPPKSNFELFGKYIPIRRSMDTSFFWIFDTLKEYEEFEFEDGKPINAFVKSENAFYFGRFKNVEKIGVQKFDIFEIRGFCPSETHFDLGLDYLYKLQTGTRLIKNLNPTSQFAFWNTKLSNNSFRHHLETVVAPKLSKTVLIQLQRWLCHSAMTAQKYYRNE